MFIRYIFSATKNLTKENVDEIVQKIENAYPEGSELVMTLADILLEEGEESGIRKGKEAVVKKLN
ncbi:MAG TPA: hypothetical protein VK105_21025 [Virgibacillus sp.]|nr:hypothetical protein [Virgibacillus sp.]HLR69578.1 hypothetical protein [Virgibacillus sp.]